MNKKIVNQIERLIKHNETILDDLYGKFLVKEDGIHFMESEQSSYARLIGWVDSLRWVLSTINNGSTISDTPLIDEEVSAEVQMLKQKENK